ncbi:hypothetical protein COLO4_23579 [Corchorus olitorius]|uniref:Uncharacterized protein n=1 Tax=Corchorus olitorius TaxID=93759 RepID=A0A1R3IFS3_9ROSI|nr:hypothetical protein COLO4_23579 [Corchorus olitorius]
MPFTQSSVDVFAFGIILVGLIAKECERTKSKSGDMVSLVHESLEVDPDFEFADGLEVTKLAKQCMAVRRFRAKIDGVVQQLSKLHALRNTLKL